MDKCDIIYDGELFFVCGISGINYYNSINYFFIYLCKNYFLHENFFLGILNDYGYVIDWKLVERLFSGIKIEEDDLYLRLNLGEFSRAVNKYLENKGLINKFGIHR